MQSSFAGTVSQSGKITELWVNDLSNSNVVFLSLGQYYSTPCRTSGQSRYFLLDLSVPSMKEAYAMALSAMIAGRSVNVKGVDTTCIANSNSLKLIYLN